MIAVFISVHSFVEGCPKATQEIEIQSIHSNYHKPGVGIVKPAENENGLLVGEIIARDLPTGV
jgi:hypothetical protein